MLFSVVICCVCFIHYFAMIWERKREREREREREKKTLLTSLILLVFFCYSCSITSPWVILFTFFLQINNEGIDFYSFFFCFQHFFSSVDFLFSWNLWGLRILLFGCTVRKVGNWNKEKVQENLQRNENLVRKGMVFSTK